MWRWMYPYLAKVVEAGMMVWWVVFAWVTIAFVVLHSTLVPVISSLKPILLWKYEVLCIAVQLQEW